MEHSEQDEFAQALISRIRQARRTLREAAGGSGGSAVAEALDELERALLLARENGIEVPDEPEGAGDEEVGS